MSCITWVGLPLVAATLVGACAGSDESARRGGGSEADSAGVQAAKAPTELRVSNVMIGRRIGTGNRMVEPTFEFGSQDTVYISVATEGSAGPGVLTAAWRSQTGEIIQQSTDTVKPGENTAFQLFRPKGLRPGTYKVVLFLGGDSADAKVFVVKK